MTSANTPIPIAIISPVRTKDHSPVKATSRQTIMRIAARAGRSPGVDVAGICLFVPEFPISTCSLFQRCERLLSDSRRFHHAGSSAPVRSLMRANLVAALLADLTTRPDLPRLSSNSAIRRQNLASKSRHIAGGFRFDDSRIGAVVGMLLQRRRRSEVVVGR